MQKKNTILVFGPGWLGHKFATFLGGELTDTDISDKNAVAAILDEKKPGKVINCAGKTGKPNIDWCETHQGETVESNITGALTLAKACLDRDIALTHLGSGCIFDGASAQPGGFTEEDIPSPPSFYSRTKAWTDEILKHFPVLILRIRMPIDKEPSPRNLITKLVGYPKIIDAENSVTIVDDLLVAAKQLIEMGKTGIFHVTNPGAIKHRDIMRWYQEIVDPHHTYELIAPSELIRQGLARAGRSNCTLSTSKLEQAGVHLRSAREAILECLKTYKNIENKKK